MIGGGCTDKDKGPGKEMARGCNGHRRITGRPTEREREGWTGEAEEWAARELLAADILSFNLVNNKKRNSRLRYI